MVKKYVLAASSAMLLAVAAPAAAQQGDDRMRVSAALNAGTLGIGPEVGLRVTDHIGVRAGASWFGIDGSFDSDDLEYDGKLNLESYAAMVDVYPFGGSFRVSAGARINKNRARLDATPDETAEVGGEEFTAAEIGTLTGRAEVKDFAPALTLGWGGSRKSGLFFGFEAGVLFQGSVRIRDFTSTGTLAADPDFRAALARERDDLQDDVDDYKVYPILQGSIGFRF